MDVERVHLQRMIEMLQGNLHTYEEQATAFGELYVPAFLKRQIEETSEELRRAKERLVELEPSVHSQRHPIPSVPQNLPPRVDLIGRVEERTKSLQALRSPTQSVLISGMMGIGKTALAKDVAHELWDTGFCQAVVWTSSENQPLTLNTIIDMIGYVLDYPYLMRVSANEKPLAALSLLRSHHTLLVVDGFEKIEDPQVEQFLNRIPAPSKFLVVSGKRRPLFDNAYTLTLRGLKPNESIELIHREAERLHMPGISKAPEALLLELRTATSGNPYALKLSIGQLRAGLSLESIIARLEAAQGQVFEDIYANSWPLLGPNPRRLLMAMTVFGGPVSRHALESVSGVIKWDFEDSLAQLIEMSLMDTNEEFRKEKIRYNILPLTRSFAVKKLQEINQEAQILHSTAAKYVEVYCKEHQRNFEKLQLELDNIKAVTKWCSEYMPERHIRLARLLYPFYRDCGYWEEAIWHNQSATDLANRLEGYLDEKAWLLCQQISIYIRRGSNEELQKADEALIEAGEIFSKSGSDIGICAVLDRQARVAEKRRRFEEAVEIAKKALDIAFRLKITSRIADIQHELGDTYRRMGKLDLAQAHYEKSLDLFQQLGDDIRITGRFNDLGNIARLKGEWTKAKSLYQRSIQLASELNKKDTLCRALNGSALVEEEMGFQVKALRQARQAKEITSRLGATFEAQQASETIGRIEKSLHNNRVFIFDFDNTLVDSTSLHIEAWTLASRHFGYNLPALKLQRVIEKGLGSEAAAIELGIDSNHSEEVVQLKRSLFRDDALAELRFFPEVPTVLDKLKREKYILVIASMNNEVVIQEVLNRLDLDQYFTEIVGQESVNRKQPDPELINLLLERIPVPKPRWVFVGDSPSDYEAARRAGIRFIHCSRNQTASPEDFKKAWGQVEKLDQILEMML